MIGHKLLFNCGAHFTRTTKHETYVTQLYLPVEKLIEIDVQVVSVVHVTRSNIRSYMAARDLLPGFRTIRTHIKHRS
jgi:hypothetical protein